MTSAGGATQGQRLEKLMAHDFSTPRGRTVAEKNAYVLLRKRNFKAAAAVFLLARPAMLKEALQVKGFARGRDGREFYRSSCCSVFTFLFVCPIGISLYPENIRFSFVHALVVCRSYAVQVYVRFRGSYTVNCVSFRPSYDTLARLTLGSKLERKDSRIMEQSLLYNQGCSILVGNSLSVLDSHKST